MKKGVTQLVCVAMLFAGVLVACSQAPDAPLEQPVGPRVEWQLLGATNTGYPVRQVLSGLEEPWGMSFLPDGGLLITQRTGALLHYSAGDLQEIGGTPEVTAVGQGGLLDVLVAPASEGSPWVYLSYSVADADEYSTRVMRGRLSGNQLSQPEILFTAQPYYPRRNHFGSRLHIDEAGFLFITVGDRGNRAAAQDLSSHAGKIIRLHADGALPLDNPFRSTKNARPEIFSYGHRNPQGIAVNPVDGSLWISEHGPEGGDEINRVVSAGNYGWPVVTYGEEYGGGKIGIGTHKPGIAGPAEYFIPSIGTAGMLFYSHEHLPAYTSHLLVGMLRGRGFSIENGAQFRPDIAHRALKRTGVKSEMEALPFRVRDMEQAVDGTLWLLADGDKLLKISRRK